MRPLTCTLALLALLSGAAWAAAPPGKSTNVVVPFYSPKTGILLCELKAERLDPSPDDPKVLLGTNVRISLFHEGKTHVLTGRKGSAHTEKNTGTVDGNVVIVFDDEQSTRVETESLIWDGAAGTVMTESHAKIIGKDLTADGDGLLVTLRETPGPKKPTRADELTLKRNVRVLVKAGASNSLLSPQSARKKSAADPPKADAAKTPQPEKPPEPIIITSAGPLTVYRGALTAIFRDDVREVQGPQKLTCDLLTLVFREVRDDEKARKEGDKTEHVLDTGRAVGKVRMDDGRTVALADLAFWKSKEPAANAQAGAQKPADQPTEPQKGLEKVGSWFFPEWLSVVLKPTEPQDRSDRFSEGAVKLVGQPAQVTWDNGNRLRAPIIYRLEGGIEFVCSPSEDNPAGAYLSAQTMTADLSPPPKSPEPSSPHP